jgi:hypothetical protein
MGQTINAKLLILINDGRFRSSGWIWNISIHAFGRQINNLPTTKPARKRFVVVFKRLTLEHTGPKRTAHLRHTWLVSLSCRALSLAGHGSKHTSNAEGLGSRALILFKGSSKGF